MTPADKLTNPTIILTFPPRRPGDDGNVQLIPLPLSCQRDIVAERRPQRAHIVAQSSPAREDKAVR